MSQEKEINRRKMIVIYDHYSEKQGFNEGNAAGVAKDWFEPEAEINGELEWFDVNEIDIQFLIHRGE